MAVVTLPGEVDISNADLLREVLLAAIDDGASVLIADMSATEFADSAVLSALIAAHQQADAVGAAFRLVVAAAGVMRVLSVTGVDQLIPLYPTLASAEAGDAWSQARMAPEAESVPD